MRRILQAALAALALLAPAVADAALVLATDDRAAFLAAAAARGARLHESGLGGLPPAPFSVRLFADTGAPTTVGALSGDLASEAGLLATADDRVSLRIDIEGDRIRGLGLAGGLTDFGFGFLDGRLRVQVIGQGDVTLASGEAGPGFVGVFANTPIRAVLISVESFDPAASAAAYATLDKLSLATPLPGALPLLALALAGLGLLRRRT